MATVKPKASTVNEYLNSLPDDRRHALQAVRAVIRRNLGEGIEEGMQYGMIGYFIPHSVYPPGYHCDPKQPLPFAGLASQKGHMSLYLCTIYASPGEQRWFVDAWAKSGKKLDMGKACIRFKKLDDVPLDVVAEAFRRISAREFIAVYESNLRPSPSRVKPAAKASTGQRASSKAAAKPAGRTTSKPKPSARPTKSARKIA